MNEALWMKIGLAWVLIQNILKAAQDAEDSEPPNLKDKPLARIAYYMQAVGSYLFTGNRIQPIQKTGA
jgi:hypothetical protein